MCDSEQASVIRPAPLHRARPACNASAASSLAPACLARVMPLPGPLLPALARHGRRVVFLGLACTSPAPRPRPVACIRLHLARVCDRHGRPRLPALAALRLRSLASARHPAARRVVEGGAPAGRSFSSPPLDPEGDQAPYHPGRATPARPVPLVLCPGARLPESARHFQSSGGARVLLADRRCANVEAFDNTSTTTARSEKK